jgi:hypothetical protein
VPLPREDAVTVEYSGGAIAAFFERADDEAIERWTADLPRERVVESLHAVTELRRALAVAEKMLKSRVIGDAILSTAEVWTAPDGRDFMWAGDRERVCANPDGLRAALEDIVVSAQANRALKQAFKDQPPKVYLTYLDQVAKFGGDEVERTIRSFVTWKESAPKLRALDEEGK